MKLCRHVLILLIITVMATLPMVNTALAQDSATQYGKPQITPNPPRMMATAEEKLPAEEKSGIGKYVIMGAIGVALVALAAGGGGGGGGSSTTSSDTGTVEVGW